jgi:hypothetical protein
VSPVVTQYRAYARLYLAPFYLFTPLVSPQVFLLSSYSFSFCPHSLSWLYSPPLPLSSSSLTSVRTYSTLQEDGFDNSIAFDELCVTMRFLARAFTDSESGTLTDPTDPTDLTDLTQPSSLLNHTISIGQLTSLTLLALHAYLTSMSLTSLLTLLTVIIELTLLIMLTLLTDPDDSADPTDSPSNTDPTDPRFHVEAPQDLRFHRHHYGNLVQDHQCSLQRHHGDLNI